MQVLKHTILNGCLEGNILICFDNIKMCLKETSFDLTLSSSNITEGKKRDHLIFKDFSVKKFLK